MASFSVLPGAMQSLYLSQISQIISVEKNCHVEKFWRNFWKLWRYNWKFRELLRNFGKFCHNLRVFVWRKIKPKSTFVEKKMTHMRSAGNWWRGYSSLLIIKHCCSSDLNSIFIKASIVFRCARTSYGPFNIVPSATIALRELHSYTL